VSSGMRSGTGSWAPTLGEYVRIRDSGSPGDKSRDSSSAFTDRGLVLSFRSDDTGLHVRFKSLVYGGDREVPVDRVAPDRWGPVRHGWDSIYAILGEQHVVVQFAVLAVGILVAIWVGTGIVETANSNAIYRFVGATWGAVKYGVIWGLVLGLIVVAIVALFERIRRIPDAVESKPFGPGVLYTILAAIILAAGFGAWQGWVNATMSTSIGEIEADRSSFDGEGVHVDGYITDYRQHVSRAGNRYVTATLCEDGTDKCIDVFEWGDADPSVADTGWAEVWGTYRVANRVGGYTFPNEIDANDIASTNAPDDTTGDQQ